MSNANPLTQLLDRFDEVPAAVALRTRTYDLLALERDDRVVDVGCGTGRAVAELDERGVRAVGVDVDTEMLDLARQRWSGRDFRNASADRLPFRDGELAGYRADKVYHAVPDPVAAVAEAWRVLAPGGRAVLLGQDWDALAVDSDEPALTRAIVRARTDTVPNPWAARAFRRLLLDTGFAEVAVEVPTGVFTEPDVVVPMLQGFAANATSHGAVSAADADRWLADQSRRARADRLFLAVPMVVSVAVRPAAGRGD